MDMDQFFMKSKHALESFSAVIFSEAIVQNFPIVCIVICVWIFFQMMIQKISSYRISPLLSYVLSTGVVLVAFRLIQWYGDFFIEWKTIFYMLALYGYCFLIYLFARTFVKRRKRYVK